MLFVRPAKLDDLDDLQTLAAAAGIGMTNLPADRDLLAAKVELSQQSLNKSTLSKPGEEFYFFVMEDTDNQRVVGTTGIIAGVGLSRPFYSFKILRLTHTSQELQQYQPVQVLQMVEEYRGCTEVATLYLSPDYRKDRNGRLLSRCRFLFLAQFPERFANLVFAEMRGVNDDQGHSIFWENVGQHFIDMEFSKADFLSAQGKYQFIADLMPKYPIYIRLLPKQVQEVIGVAHEATKPALKLLQREGFRFEGCVDVFDAGPTVHCPLSYVATVQDSESAQISAIGTLAPSEEFMISTTELSDFAVCRGYLRQLDDDSVILNQEVADLLQLTVGDDIRFVKF